jgi:hypothetical protein
MSDLARQVARMLAAFGSSSDDRVGIYVEAVREEAACETCAARAARALAREAQRRPVPRQLLDATRELMGSAEHVRHAERRQLPSGGGSAWLASEGRAIVLEAWPGISAEDLDLVMAELERQVSCGALEPTRRGLIECLGWVDEYGPTTERRWWERHLAFARRSAEQEGAA